MQLSGYCGLEGGWQGVTMHLRCSEWFYHAAMKLMVAMGLRVVGRVLLCA